MNTVGFAPAVRAGSRVITSELSLAAVPLKSRFSCPSTKEMGNVMLRYSPAGFAVSWTLAIFSAVIAISLASAASPATRLTV
jgi:hypothetical protein